MGGSGLRGRVLPDEALRSEPHSRGHSPTGIQEKAIDPGRACSLDVRWNAFGSGLAAGPELGLGFPPDLGCDLIVT